MPTSPLPPARTPSDWHPTNKAWQQRNWTKPLEQSHSQKRNGGDPDPPDNPGTAKNMSLFMVCGYTHGGYLMVRTAPSPDVEGEDDVHNARICRTSHQRQMTSAWLMDKSGQGPKRAAVAEAKAIALGIQQYIHSTEDSSYKKPVVGQCSCKSYYTSSAQCNVGVPRCKAKMKRSPRVDDERRLKAAQEASLTRKKYSQALPPY
jgi:hypothetical protein